MRRGAAGEPRMLSNLSGVQRCAGARHLWHGRAHGEQRWCCNILCNPRSIFCGTSILRRASIQRPRKLPSCRPRSGCMHNAQNRSDAAAASRRPAFNAGASSAPQGRFLGCSGSGCSSGVGLGVLTVTSASRRCAAGRPSARTGGSVWPSRRRTRPWRSRLWRRRPGAREGGVSMSENGRVLRKSC